MNAKSRIYCLLLLLMRVALTALVVGFAIKSEDVLIKILTLVGVVLSFGVPSLVHETGHILFGKKVGFELQSVRFGLLFDLFVFVRKNGKMKAWFAPQIWATGQTQMLPKFGGNMKKRAKIYALGGLRFSLIVMLVLSACAVACVFFCRPVAFMLFAMLPEFLRLYLLNVVPCAWTGGKTDARIVKGIKQGDDEEKVMLAEMEIFGALFEGKTYAEIDETYFAFPVIAEDSPLFLSAVELSYYRALDQGNEKSAIQFLNRLSSLSEYMTAGEERETLKELLYLNAKCGRKETAEEAYRRIEPFLEDAPKDHRALAAYFCCIGENEKGKECARRGVGSLQSEPISGQRKLEEKLLNGLLGE